MASELLFVPHDLEFQATIPRLDTAQVIFDRYRLIKVLGRGGMGVVWLAQDQRLDREVALKVLPEEIGFDAEAEDEMKRETRRCLDLTHVNIVRIHDFMKDRQAAAISMEYVDGKTLTSLKIDRPNRIFSVDEIAPWIAQACQALAYAHDDVGIIHRDLKPANMMLTSRGHVKIADFGIAQSMHQSFSRMTMRRGTSGTLSYMSPQQLSGEIACATDDVYALGATVYELLTSKPPFYLGDVPYQIRLSTPPRMTERRQQLGLSGPDIPQHWEEVIAACLSKVAEERPQSMAELADGLGLARPVRKKDSSTATAFSARPNPPVVADPSPGIFRTHTKRRAFMLGGLGAGVLLISLLVTLLILHLTAPGAIKLTSDPPGAIVHLSGLPDRTTPALFPQVPSGGHTITVTAEGFEPAKWDVALAAGTALDLGSIKLQRSVGSLSLDTIPPDAHYSLESTGAAPRFHQEGSGPARLTALPTGAYRLMLSAPGWEPATQTPEIAAHQTNSISIRLTALPAPKVVPAPAPVEPAPAPVVPDAGRGDLVALYHKNFDDALSAGHLADAAAQLEKLKTIGEKTDQIASQLQQKRASLEQDLSKQVADLISASRLATAGERLKNVASTLEAESITRLRTQFQAVLDPYQQEIAGAIKTAQALPPPAAYAQLQALLGQHPDDLDVQLALVNVQTQMPPDQAVLTVQLGALQQFSQLHPDFSAETSLAASQALLENELQKLTGAAAAVSTAKEACAVIQRQIASLKHRKSIYEDRRVGAPKTNPFNQTINFFGKAVTGHDVVDNEAYFSSARRKREAIDDLEGQIAAAQQNLVAPQAALDSAQQEYEDLIAAVPWK